MDDRLRARVKGFVEQLIKEEKASLRAAKTFVDIEDLAVEVGDEVARSLASSDLAQRSVEATTQQRFACPDCSRVCPIKDELEPLILQGKRGEIEYSEPCCHCRSCRRDFFPGGGTTAAARA